MLPSVLLKTLRDSRRAVAWWSVGLCSLASMMVAVFPSVRGNPGLNKLVQDYPEALKAFIAFGGSVDYTSAAGYLGSELFSFMVPLLLLVASIGAGARAIAGEEEQGTLDLLVSNPLSRRRLVFEKLGALVLEIAFLGAVLWVALGVGTRVAGMEIGLANLAAATLDATLLALLFGVLALLVGSAVGRRGLALAVSTAAAVIAYLVNALAAIVDALEPVQKLSPFYHYVAGDPLRQGLALDHAAVLALTGVAVAALAPFVFDARDLT